MPETHTLLVFVPVALGLLVVPGPAVLYIVTRSIDQGRAAGIASVLGIHTGSLVHIGAAAAGLSALLVSSSFRLLGREVRRSGLPDRPGDREAREEGSRR